MNIIQGVVSSLNGEAAEVVWSEGKPPIRGMTGEGIAMGATASFVVRPEKVAITTEEPIETTNRVSGKVEDIAYLGNMSTYYVRLDSGELIKSQVSNNRRIARRGITWEDSVWLSWRDTAGIVLST